METSALHSIISNYGYLCFITFNHTLNNMYEYLWSRRHYLKYHKIYILNQRTNLNWSIEWQRSLQMVSYKIINLNVNEDFCNVFDFRVNNILYWHFHFGYDIPVNYLSTKWSCTHILDWTSNWSPLNMGFVDKRPSRLQGNCCFQSGARDNSFRLG